MARAVRRLWRLRHRDDFERLRTEGNVWKHPALQISVCANRLPHNRYGIITSKRVGKAVQRNRLRRQLRAGLRELHPTLIQGYDVVVIARPASTAPHIDYHALVEALNLLMQRAGLRTKISS